MISVEQARAAILEQLRRLPAETVSLWEASGRVLDEDVVASHDVPPFRNSAMDGYAVRVADVERATPDHPILLEVVGTIAAGDVTNITVGEGQAARIMTGAPVPAGADAVVRFEESSEAWDARARPAPGTVAICAPAARWSNVREAGEDLRIGDTVLEAGMTLHPASVGILAALGRFEVPVVRRPRVAILATGDELVPADAPLQPGTIRNTNEYVTAAMVQQAGGIPLPLGIARDTIESLTAKLHEGLAAGVDLFLTSAGVSVGDYDRVKDGLAMAGEVHFWQVAIKPGKPLAFGVLDYEGRRVPLLGLPGNPVAAMVAFHVFARPALRFMGGRTPLVPPRRKARLVEAVENSGRRHYMRAKAFADGEGALSVTTRGSGVRVQGSGIMSSMVWANCFVVVPEGVTHLPAGADVDIEMFQWMEEM